VVLASFLPFRQAVSLGAHCPVCLSVCVLPFQLTKQLNENRYILYLHFIHFIVSHNKARKPEFVFWELNLIYGLEILRGDIFGNYRNLVR